MKKILFSCLLFILIPCDVLVQRVLIIRIDGCRADVAEIANTPFLDEFKTNGLYSPDAWNDDITISGPGWSANLCSVWSENHLVTGNNFADDNYAQYPSVFQRIETFTPQLDYNS